MMRKRGRKYPKMKKHTSKYSITVGLTDISVIRTLVIILGHRVLKFNMPIAIERHLIGDLV